MRRLAFVCSGGGGSPADTNVLDRNCHERQRYKRAEASTRSGDLGIGSRDLAAVEHFDF